jgi:hypothetical protein
VRLRCALVVMVAAWVVAGCTSPHRAASRPRTTAPSASTAPPSSSAEPTPTTTAIEPTTTIEPSLGLRLPRCHTNQVTVRGGSASVGAGNVVAVYVLENTSATTCRVFGYPGLQMLDSHHRPVPTTVTRGAYMFPAKAPSRVIVLPRGSASFSIGYREVPSGEEPASVQCVPSTYVEITPPDEHLPLLLSGGMAPCGHGEIFVSPVVSGEDGVGFG